ncbi:MAG: GNAT family N-acetyltransferase [Proteobacteria bacterium]|nr:GNAT family N-acetyltransferase [Pseudomonadota bacterium]
MPDIRTERMRVEEMALAVDWAAAEGWNPGLDDAAAFHAADLDGHFLTRLDGRPVACISAVKYGPDYAFVGFYICLPEFRGRGLGMAIWNTALASIGDRALGLDGVVDQQANYAKSGFVLKHRTIRYGGPAPAASSTDSRLRPIDGSLLPAVRDYDRAFSPAPRDRYLSAWLGPCPTRRGLALVEDGTVTGYGVIRRCRSGCKIGPLFAEDAAGADILFRALAADAAGGEIFLDLPEPNGEAIDLAEGYGLAPVFEPARMYRGIDPDISIPRTFGITTFELG